MKRIIGGVIVIAIIWMGHVQDVFGQDSVAFKYNASTNIANSMLNSDRKLNIGGYAQIDYNQPFGGNTHYNGKLDVHRLVLLFGYRFTNKLSFVTEIEVEHVKEVYVEQAFLNYALNTYVNFRGGLLLIPMGIVNEYHEPPTFNGVERPLIDKYIVPTTWREIGAGITGTIPEVSMRYQAYLVNGFKSYNSGDAYITGKSGLRGGRQKGAESFITFPNFTARVEYYGVLGLNLGLSGYVGKTQSSAYHKIDKEDSPAIATADSSVVGVSMVGFDMRYQRKGFQLKGQVYYTSLTNTEQYNYYTAEQDDLNDAGSSMYGYYIELAYNVFHPFRQLKGRLTPFVRYSNYDTQYTVVTGITKNNAYQNTIITTGIGYWFIPQVAIKTDVQFLKSKSEDKFNQIFNAGIAVMF
ncbi:MAG: hypothetical protein V2I62_09805 [Bacteroidales bacterium]|nr:hypothetical protein [Bacteroidales bacterium]